MHKRNHIRYQAIADFIHPWHLDCHHVERVTAENAAALAWRLHHPIQYRLTKYWIGLRDGYR